MSSSTNRLRCRTWASPGSSLWSDSANSFATSSSDPGLIRATMQPRLTWRSALLLQHLGLGVLAEEAGPALDVHHPLPHEVERSVDCHGVVGVRCHLPTLPPPAYGSRTRWTVPP